MIHENLFAYTSQDFSIFHTRMELKILNIFQNILVFLAKRHLQAELRILQVIFLCYSCFYYSSKIDISKILLSLRICVCMCVCMRGKGGGGAEIPYPLGNTTLP